MEKIEIGKCLSELPNGDAGKIVGLSGVNGVLTTPGKITEAGGCGTFLLGSLNSEKWFRIAIGGFGSAISTALINIGKNYNNSAPTSQLLYVSADGYSGNQIATILANSGISIKKMRILYKGVTSERVILDMYISPSNGLNNFHLSYSNNIGFTFQKAVEVPDAPDAGYLVREFTF